MTSVTCIVAMKQIVIQVRESFLELNRFSVIITSHPWMDSIQIRCVGVFKITWYHLIRGKSLSSEWSRLLSIKFDVLMFDLLV